ncbi:MAG: hypothetical protein RR406_04885 [Bacilli bacterium]
MTQYKSFQELINAQINHLLAIKDKPYLITEEYTYTSHEIVKILSRVNLTKKKK